MQALKCKENLELGLSQDHNLSLFFSSGCRGKVAIKMIKCTLWFPEPYGFPGNSKCVASTAKTTMLIVVSKHCAQTSVWTNIFKSIGNWMKNNVNEAKQHLGNNDFNASLYCTHQSEEYVSVEVVRWPLVCTWVYLLKRKGLHATAPVIYNHELSRELEDPGWQNSLINIADRSLRSGRTQSHI